MLIKISMVPVIINTKAEMFPPGATAKQQIDLMMTAMRNGDMHLEDILTMGHSDNLIFKAEEQGNA